MTQSSSYPPAAEASSAPRTASQTGGSASQTKNSAPQTGSFALQTGSSAPQTEPAAPGFISAEPLDIVGLLAGAHHPGAGAVVLFSGEVRNSNKGLAVEFLEYEAYIALAERL